MDPNNQTNMGIENQNNLVNSTVQAPLTQTVQNQATQAPVATPPVQPVLMPENAATDQSPNVETSKKKFKLNFKFKITKNTLIIFCVVVVALILVIYFSMSNNSLKGQINNLRNTNFQLNQEKETWEQEKAELEAKAKENLNEQKSEELLANVPDGYLVYSLKLEASISYGDEITPESLIDVYMKTTIGSSPINNVFVENIKVIMLKDNKGNNIYSTMASTRAEEIIFAVPKEAHDYLIKAQDISGVTLYPVVKGGSPDRKEVKMASQYLNDYVESKYSDVPQD